MRKKLSFKGVWALLKQSFSGFSEDNIPKMSGALAYYTVFSLAPLMIVIIFLAGIFLGKEAVEGSVYAQLQGFIGDDAARQMQDMIRNASVSDKGTVAAVIGIIALLIGATSVFAEIQDSINTIWRLKPKPKSGLWIMVRNRLLSFGIVGSLSFLLLVSLVVTAVIEALGKKLQAIFPDVTIILFYIINLVLTLGVTTLLFAVIFKVLPDAKIKWRNVWIGAFATSILFLLGKFGISFYISKSDIGSTYGAAGSLVVLLVWVYYSAMILYFGAEFTKAYVSNYGNRIIPKEYAVAIDKVVKEKGSPAADTGRKHQDFGNMAPASTPTVPRPVTVSPVAAARFQDDSVERRARLELQTKKHKIPPAEQPFGSFAAAAIALVAIAFHGFRNKKEQH